MKLKNNQRVQFFFPNVKIENDILVSGDVESKEGTVLGQKDSVSVVQFDGEETVHIVVSKYLKKVK